MCLATAHTHTGLECLSPPLHLMAIRPEPVVVDKTSTSLTIEWEEPPLSAECADVFSFPPLNYIIAVADPMISPFIFNNAVRTLFVCDNTSTYWTVQYRIVCSNCR